MDRPLPLVHPPRWNEEGNFRYIEGPCHMGRPLPAIETTFFGTN